MSEVFNAPCPLNSDNAKEIKNIIHLPLQTDEFRPSTVLDRFDIALIAITKDALDGLCYHKAKVKTGYENQFITTFWPDDIIDANKPEFPASLKQVAELTRCYATGWASYLDHISLIDCPA